MKEQFKIMAIVKINNSKSLVLDRRPEFIYEREGNIIFANDNGIYNCFGYQTPSKAFRAFAGRKFNLPMKDGSFTKCNGQWWDSGINKLEELKGIKIARLSFGTIEELKKCYVYTSCSYWLFEYSFQLMTIHFLYFS